MYIECVIFGAFLGALFGTFIGAFVIIGLVFNSDRFEDYTLHIFVGFMIIGAAIGGYIGAQSEWSTNQYEIYSLGDSNLIEGHFILGSGSFNSEPVFIFYKGVGNGGYQLGHVYAENSIIYEDCSGSTGYVITRNPPCSCGNKIHEIHVPKGTIKRQFNLDSE